ncbi:MAG: lyase family protein [Burkholderiales bacterium]
MSETYTNQENQGSEFYLMGEEMNPITNSSVGHDAFHWMGEMNKAATVILAEQAVISAELAKAIGGAVAKVIADGALPNAERPGNYMIIEKLLVKAGGAEVTRVHSGRSRQDMLATTHRLFIRDQLLDSFDSLARLREGLLELAARHAHDLVPAYTHNVQAQPTTFGHYLLAFAAAYQRTATRMREAWARVNLSPLGAAALGTSSFAIDRARLAQLLGFDGVVENSLDANHVAPCDMSIELAGIVASGALTGDALISDILGQYRQPTPWITLREGGLTGSSTIMPQKRNPIVLVAARHLASNVLAQTQACLLVAHNIGTGLLEHRGNEALVALQSMSKFFAMLNSAVRSLQLNVPRARAEIDAEYSTTTELADVLQRDAGVPFRTGHHFASELVNYGRGNALWPAQIPFSEAQRIYAEAQRIYTEAAGATPGTDSFLPLSEARFRQALSPDNMVRASRGLGGPQPAEVNRMLTERQDALRSDRMWLDDQRQQLRQCEQLLDIAFASARGEKMKTSQ